MLRLHRSPRLPRVRQAGQSMVEFALLLPLFLLLTVGLVDAARAFWTYTSLQNVAAEGARAAVSIDLSPVGKNCLTGGSSGNTQTAVQKAVAEAPVFGLDTSPLSGSSAPLANANFALKGNDPSSNATLCNNQNTPIISFTFTAKYNFTPIVGLVLGRGTIAMTATSTMLH